MGHGGTGSAVERGHGGLRPQRRDGAVQTRNQVAGVRKRRPDGSLGAHDNVDALAHAVQRAGIHNGLQRMRRGDDSVRLRSGHVAHGARGLHGGDAGQQGSHCRVLLRRGTVGNEHGLTTRAQRRIEAVYLRGGILQRDGSTRVQSRMSSGQRCNQARGRVNGASNHGFVHRVSQRWGRHDVRVVDGVDKPAIGQRRHGSSEVVAGHRHCLQAATHCHQCVHRHGRTDVRHAARQVGVHASVVVAHERRHVAADGRCAASNGVGALEVDQVVHPRACDAHLQHVRVEGLQRGHHLRQRAVGSQGTWAEGVAFTDGDVHRLQPTLQR